MKITPVTAAGGVLFKQENGELAVLLIHRKGRWDLPKGKLEGEESIRECARREVSEEVGCPLPVVVKKLTTTYHEYDEDGKRVGKTTHWYAMETDMVNGFEPEEREGITEVAWSWLEEAHTMVGYENLRTVLHHLENWKTQTN